MGLLGWEGGVEVEVVFALIVKLVTTPTCPMDLSGGGVALEDGARAFQRARSNDLARFYPT
jgi:hypothetical protein